MPTRASRLAGHIPQLDGVRGIAILSVLVFHIAQEYRLPVRLTLVTGFGWAGVDLFFVLSGFLITGILLDSQARPNYYGHFFARRTRRIVPLYAAYVGVLALTVPGDWLPWYLTYTMNVRIALANSWAVAIANTPFFWSLCVEEQFYAGWPWLVRHTRRPLPLCLGLILVAFAVRVVAVTTGHPFAAYTLLPARMDALAIGASVAVLARRAGGLDRLARWAPGVLMAALLGLGAVVARTHYTGWDSTLMQTVGYPLNALASAALLGLAVARQGLVARLATHAPLRYAGRRAYGLYVLSGLAIHGAGLLHAPRAVTALVAVVLAFLLAEASWRLIERPLTAPRARPIVARAEA